MDDNIHDVAEPGLDATGGVVGAGIQLLDSLFEPMMYFKKDISFSLFHIAILLAK